MFVNNWWKHYDRLFFVVKAVPSTEIPGTSRIELLGKVAGNLFWPDFINWEKAKALGITVHNVGERIKP